MSDDFYKMVLDALDRMTLMAQAHEHVSQASSPGITIGRNQRGEIIYKADMSVKFKLRPGTRRRVATHTVVAGEANSLLEAVTDFGDFLNFMAERRN